MMQQPFHNTEIQSPVQRKISMSRNFRRNLALCLLYDLINRRIFEIRSERLKKQMYPIEVMRTATAWFLATKNYVPIKLWFIIFFKFVSNSLLPSSLLNFSLSGFGI